MDCVSPILSIATCLWDCTDKHTLYIRDLEENLASLGDSMIELRSRKKDVKRRVEVAESGNLHRTNEVSVWLESVEAKEKEVNEILQKGNAEIQRKFLKCCPKNPKSSYELGKIVTNEVVAVKELLGKGRFDVVADQLPRDIVDEMPIEESTIGLDSMFSKVWRCIEDKCVRIIGIYGMGGVGKTTLLKKINNYFADIEHDFDFVIWVLVSKEANMKKIQDVIGNKLGIVDARWASKDEEEKAAEIHKCLKRKKFVLMLDDLWARLDLLRVGIPILNDQNQSKVLFTTRWEEVCGTMEAHRWKFKVECLSAGDALDLFKTKVGEQAWNAHHDIPKLAEIIVNECKGLPLALITIGRAFASRKKPEEWKHAIKVLQSYPSKFSGMGDHVFPILKFSYDSLSDNVIKNCFLYCCLFPEDYDIPRAELIEYWIGEGLITRESLDIHKQETMVNILSEV